MAETSAETFQGRVKWFNPKAGYGFITLLHLNEDNEDVFVHHSGLKPKKECFKTLYQGEYVSLNILTDEHGKKFGTEVTGVGGHELMCERFAGSEDRRNHDRSDNDRGYDRGQDRGNWNTVNRRRNDNSRYGNRRRDDRRDQRE